MQRLIPTGTCWCGCGAETTIGAFFLPGHDRVAEAAVVLAEYGGVPQFLEKHGYAPGNPDGQNPREALDRVRAKAPWKYQLLADHLAAQPAAQQRVTLTFPEIDALLAPAAAALPASARAHRPWWANDRTHSQAKAWLDRGWETGEVDMAGESVTFTRRTEQ